ncbi:MAG: MFS transporter [Candidatus Omnitrophota bacterium]
MCLEGILISFNTAAIAAIVPAVGRSLFIPESQASRIIPYYMIPYGFGALLYAPLLKYFAPKPIKLITLFLFTIFCLFCGSAYYLNVLLFSRVFAGLAAAAVIPLTLVIIGQAVPKENRGRMVGWFFSLTFIASITGVFLSGILPWRWLFFIPAVLGLLTTGLVFFFFPDDLPKLAGLKTNYFQLLLKKEIVGVFAFIFLVSLIYHASYNWLGVYLERVYRLEQMGISMFLTLIGLSGACGQVLGGFMTDRKGRVASAYFGLIILSVSIMLLAAKLPAGILALVFVLFGIGWTVNHNALATLLTDFPDKYRAEVSSLNSAVRFISGGLGVALSGLFIEKNFANSYLGFGIILIVLSIFVNYLLKEPVKL